MEELIVELRLFLELLDHEYLTSTVREKKAVITNILLRIQSSKGQCQGRVCLLVECTELGLSEIGLRAKDKPQIEARQKDRVKPKYNFPEHFPSCSAVKYSTRHTESILGAHG